MLESILHMLIHRWYVFTFLLVYLAVGSLHWGWRRSLKLLVIGYAIAWASEASSIRTGFPYGFYSYHYDVLAGEPLVWGVPFWDSLSYPFLCFAGYMMALFLRSRWNPHAAVTDLQRSWKTVLWGALWTMILDVVIDPLAHRGAQWFLGDIYHYPAGGFYFDVTLSNFIGWFLVALAILSAFRLTDNLEGVPKKPWTPLLGAGLYGGIYLFNLGITVYIRAWWLALASAGWGVLLLILSSKRATHAAESSHK
jgi:putative membrane protein